MNDICSTHSFRVLMIMIKVELDVDVVNRKRFLFVQGLFYRLDRKYLCRKKYVTKFTLGKIRWKANWDRTRRLFACLGLWKQYMVSCSAGAELFPGWAIQTANRADDVLERANVLKKYVSARLMECASHDGLRSCSTISNLFLLRHYYVSPSAMFFP